MPSTVVSITPPPLSSNVRVCLCGGGPGSYVDCATLSFQVPMRGSLSCADRLMTETTSVRMTPNVSVRNSDCIVLLLADISLPQSLRLSTFSVCDDARFPHSVCAANRPQNRLPDPATPRGYDWRCP